MTQQESRRKYHPSAATRLPISSVIDGGPAGARKADNGVQVVRECGDTKQVRVLRLS